MDPQPAELADAVSTANAVLAALDEALATQRMPTIDEIRRGLPDDDDVLHAAARHHQARRLLDEEIARWRERSYLYRESGRIMEQRAHRAIEDGNDLAARAAIEETEPLKELSMEADATVRELESLREELED
jgi:hypothetical protein